MDGLLPLGIAVNDQVECRTRLAHHRNKLLAAAIGVVGVIIVHQCQIALRGQCARFLIRNGDSIFFLYDFRQDRFFHRGGIALIGESRSSHADAQHRRYQQCAEFLNLHH